MQTSWRQMSWMHEHCCRPSLLTYGQGSTRSCICLASSLTSKDLLSLLSCMQLLVFACKVTIDRCIQGSLHPSAL